MSLSLSTNEATPKKILNAAENAVDEFLDGLVREYPERLIRLEGEDIILSRPAVLPQSKSSARVHLLSGGGSGHEPSHAGWVGSGMLTAAVCGGMFASPSVAAILAGIQASVSGETDNQEKSSCLLIVKNYTGDRLNFGVAASQARAIGIPTEMVVIADDVALPREKGITGARGLAGTVLVHKIAGAAAAVGKSLEEVTKIATEVAANMGTLGVALDAVTVPGAAVRNTRLDGPDNVMELGLGIHGEAGCRQLDRLWTADELAQEMVRAIKEYGRNDKHQDVVPMFSPGDKVVVLVNNLGGSSNFELSILARSCLRELEEKHQVVVVRALVGCYMTSFDMHGASLTILNVNDSTKWLDYLDADTNATAWTPVDRLETVPEPPVLSHPMGNNSDSASMPATQQMMPTMQIDFASKARPALAAAAKALIEAEPLLTRYDTVVGDGDCGITLKRGATEISRRLDNAIDMDTNHPCALWNNIATAVSASMGGTSGILLEILFRKMGASLLECNSISEKELTTALQAGISEVSLVGGAAVGSRTMLDALVPAAETLSSSLDWESAANAARKGAQATAVMKSASAGRSNYVRADELEGTPDPGAEAVAIAFEAISASF